ncbi:hypothetical protein MMC20_005610 [Loxospora ochrophaea]|nr:hypothetical protein [Loxospora ochrophaea]
MITSISTTSTYLNKTQCVTVTGSISPEYMAFFAFTYGVSGLSSGMNSFHFSPVSYNILSLLGSALATCTVVGIADVNPQMPASVNMLRLTDEFSLTASLPSSKTLSSTLLGRTSPISIVQTASIKPNSTSPFTSITTTTETPSIPGPTPGRSIRSLKIAIGISIPSGGVVFSVFAIVFWRKYRKRRLDERALQNINSSQEPHYVRQKAKLPADGVIEMGASERLAELEPEEVFELEGGGTGHEISAEER